MGTSTAAGLPEASGSRASAFQVGHRTLTACLIVSTSMIFRETLVLANEHTVSALARVRGLETRCDPLWMQITCGGLVGPRFGLMTRKRMQKRVTNDDFSAMVGALHANQC